MQGRYRNRTRPQSQAESLYKQDDFTGGLNSDKQATKLGISEVALLENFITFPDRIEGRSGTIAFSNVALPGSGTVHDIKQHSITKKFILYRGTQIWYADSAQAGWTEVKTQVGDKEVCTVAGDVGGVFATAPTIWGASASNTDAGVLYWNWTNSGGNYTLQVYKDSAKTQLVASWGPVAASTPLRLQMQNASGLRIYASVNNVATDTSAGNTFTVTTLANTYGYDVSAYFEERGEDFILRLASQDPALYINMTTLCFFRLVGYFTTPVTDSGSEGGATPYGRRYLITKSRIESSAGVASFTLNRTTGTLQFEGPATTPGSGLQDYGTYWTANPVSASNPITLAIPTVDYDLHISTPTHLSIYATFDIGSANGVDPITREGNNRELYVWVGDTDISKLTFTDNIPDATLRARFENGNFSLRTRFWSPLPVGELGCIGGSFFTKALRGASTIYYCQLARPEYIGYYNPAVQFMKTDDAIQSIEKVDNQLLICCTRSTYLLDTTIFSDTGVIEPLFVLRGPQRVSKQIGVSDYGSIAHIGENAIIAHCSDHTIRIFSGGAWGQEDLAGNKVSHIIEAIVAPGSVGGFCSGAYFLWYRTTGSTNTACLRLGFGGRAGKGWSKCAGANFPMPPLYVGTYLITDANNVQRLLVYNPTSGGSYWVDSFTNNGLTKIFKDNLNADGSGGASFTPKFRPRELIGRTEGDEVAHEESHIYLRPFGSAYVSGMTMTVRVYVDGSATAADSITSASLTGGDLQFWKRILGNHIQLEYEFSESGQIITSHDTLYQIFDRKAIGDGPAESTEAANQLALATDLRRWVTRTKKLKDRAYAANFSASSPAPAFSTGPDSKEYGLNFLSAAYQMFSPDDGGDFGSGSYGYNLFTMMFFIKGAAFTAGPITIEAQTGATATGAMSVQFTSNTNLRVFMFATNYDVTVDTIASGWHHFALVRSSATVVSVYQNGVLKGTFNPGAGLIGGAATDTALGLNGGGGGALQLYDFRMYTAVKTAANILYLYNDIVNNSGNKVLPSA